MTELADRLNKELDDGRSLRQIGRKAGMSANTVRRAKDGLELDHATLEKFAQYFKVPLEEIYRMAGNLPSMYTPNGRINRSWLMSELVKAVEMLTEAEQAEIYAHALRLAEGRTSKTVTEQTIT